MAFTPLFRIESTTAQALMAIEGARSAVDHLPLTAHLIASLRQSARLMSTHYSTQIEGNRLTMAEVEQAVAKQGGFPGRERDEREVQNYYHAAEAVEQWARREEPFKAKDIQTLHGLSFLGKAKPTPWRDGQNVIRDGGTGRIVYLPPEAKDVPGLMRDLVEWINQNLAQNQWPAPIIAAVAHYQFATIHPYFDGNGRTARLLACAILHRGGYGLKGLYSLEEYYARNLPAYYQALTVGPGHNYYDGRATADISAFVSYFCAGMADAFAKVRIRAQAGETAVESGQTPRLHADALRELRPLQRQALGLFAKQRVVTTAELAAYLGLTSPQAGRWCLKWVESGFLVMDDPSKKGRSYRLGKKFEEAHP